MRRLVAALGGIALALLAHQVTGVFDSPVRLPVHLAAAAAG